MLLVFVACMAAESCEAPAAPGPGSATRLQLSPKSGTVLTNQTMDFAVVGYTSLGDTATTLTVKWSMSGGSTVDTNTNGHVHHLHYKAAAQPGTYKLAATAQGTNATDSATITVDPVPVSSVGVTPASASITAGQTAQLTATTLDSAGNVLTGRTVTWGSSNTAIAVVSGTGLVTALAPGSATITATSETKSGTASVSVTPAPVASVTVSPATASVGVGKTAQLGVTLRDANGNILTGRVVTWGSSNTAVATVTSSGLVTGVVAGTASITATSEGQSGTAAITVSVPVASVSLAPASASIYVGQTVQLTATPKDANGNPLTGRVVTWTSSNTGAATVNGSGLVSAVGAGTTTIIATSEGQSGTATITVSLVPVATVTVTPAAPSVSAGQTVQLTATLKDSAGNTLTGRTVTWTSSNTAAATVSGSGLVTGVAAGSATITATSGGKSGTATITVMVPVASVTVAPASAGIYVGQTVQLTATPKDANGNPLTGRVVTWSSSNTGVATVNGSGLVSAVGAGSVTITATSEGQSGTATVAVTLVPVATVTVAPAAPSVNVGQTVQLTATLRDSAGNTLTGRTITWTSSSTATATVNASGLATGVAAGSATITAASGGQSGTAAVTVTVPQVASVTVAPSASTIGVGQNVQLAATPKDANGNPISGQTITWTRSNTTIASVTSGGLVNGLVVGVDTITATTAGKSGTAVVTVVNPSSIWTNEPAGLSGMANASGSRDYDFVSQDVSGANPTTSGWVNPYPSDNATGQLSLVTDPTAPAPNGVVQMMYPLGWNVGASPGEVDYNFAGRTEYYVGFYVKISDPYLGVSGGHNKLAYFFTGNKDLVFEFSPSGSSGNGNPSSGPWHFFWAEYVSHAGAEYDTYGTASLQSGVWYKVEILMSYSQGVVKWWVNGVLDGTIPCDFTNNAGGPLHLMQFSPTYGGGGAPAKTEVDYIWYDHVHMSGSP